MSAEKFLVTTKLGKGSRSIVWDASSPIPLGHPMRWILERTDQGVRLRDLTGKTTAPQSGKILNLEEPQIENGSWVSVPSQIAAHQKTDIQVKRLRPNLPAYFTPMSPGASGAGKMQPMLYAYAGVRRTLSDCNQIHSAYVAHYRGKPAFTLYHTPEGLKIRVLLSGLRLKPKGKEPKIGKAGEQWQIANADLSSITLYRGWSWWRFNLVSHPSELTESTDSEDKKDEAAFSKSLIVLALLLGSLSLVVGLLPKPQEKPLEVKIQPQTIKLTAHRKAAPKLLSSPVEGQESISGAPAPAPAAPVAAVHSPVKTAAVAKPHTAPAPKAPPKTSSQIAAERTRLLRDALRGIAPTTSQKSHASTDPTPVTAKSMFGANKAVAPSEITPVYSGSGDDKVQGIGGQGLGGAHGKQGASKGYGANGSVEGLAGRGGSFAAIGDGGGTADEGLSMDEIGAVIQSHMAEVRYCHEADLVQNPKSEGKLVMDFKIAPNGKVSEAATKSSTLVGHFLEKCIRGKLLTWKFPLPKGGVQVGVTFPFVFKTLETR